MSKQAIEKSRQEYIAGILLGLSPSQAAIRAGFARGTTNYLTTRPEIIAAIAAGHKKLIKKHEFTRDRAVEMLFEAREMAITLEDPMAVIRAIDTLIKMHGFYAPEVHELRLSTDLHKRAQQIKELSDDKLLALAEQEERVTAIDVEFEEVGSEELPPGTELDSELDSDA